MKECVLFDKDGKEIDWFDPIENDEDVIESENVLTINHQNGNIYIIDGKNYSSYIVRELPESR